jgi:UDP-N-acetylmuramyl pentapeptide synthase
MEVICLISLSKWNFKRFSFGLPGRHNLMNALMANAMVINFGTPTDAIAVALVERRTKNAQRPTTLLINGRR